MKHRPMTNVSTDEMQDCMRIIGEDPISNDSTITTLVALEKEGDGVVVTLDTRKRVKVFIDENRVVELD